MKKNILKALVLISIILIPTNLHANSIAPFKKELVMSQGTKATSSVIYTNDENESIELKLYTYEYDSKNEQIIENGNNVFLKVDTDTIVVNPKESKEIRYEIIPATNLLEGTYFNILALVPINKDNKISLSNGISQLVTIHIVPPESEVQGSVTSNYIFSMEVIRKGIPYIQSTKIKYQIQNNSNYVLTPTGSIEIFNTTGKYKPYTFRVNEDNERLYPKETLEKEIEISNWDISDILNNRKIVGYIYNGLDNNPVQIEKEIEGYKKEILIGIGVLIGLVFLGKSIIEDNKKKDKD